VDVEYLEVEVDLPASLYARRDTITGFTGRPEIAPETRLNLTLLEYYPKANLNQLYRARLKLEETQGLDLAPGMNMQVVVHLEENGGAPLMVPTTALFTDQNETYVWVLNPDSESVRRTQVTTAGVVSDGSVEIVNGLEPGQWIVTAGVHSLEDGQQVSLLGDRATAITEQ
jgi:RND family efflux transporter MFP subunit